MKPIKMLEKIISIFIRTEDVDETDQSLNNKGVPAPVLFIDQWINLFFGKYDIIFWSYSVAG